MSNNKGMPIIGRLDVIRSFEQALKKPSDNSPIVILGGSGTGKTYLLRYLRDRITPSDLPSALLDFEQINLRTDALAVSFVLASNLRLAMKPDVWEKFNKLLTEEQKNLSRLPLQLTITQTIPAQNSNISNTEQSIQASSLIRRAEEQAINIVSQELIDAISSISARPIILFIDTLERIKGSGDSTLWDWLFFTILSPLTKILQGNIVIVAAGQPPLYIERYFPSVASESLDYFTYEETAEFLLSRGGINNPSLQKNIFDITKGHPLLTDIISRVWTRETNRGQVSLPFPEIKGEFEEVARTEWVMNRVIERLDKTLGEIVRFGVILRSFNLDDLEGVFPHLLSDGVKTYERLLSYPFILRINDERHTFHELIRRVQAGFLRRQAPRDWQLLHSRAFDYYIGQIREKRNQKISTVNMIFHQLMLDEELGIASWQNEFNTALLNWDRSYLADLLSIVTDPTMQLSGISPGIVELSQGKFYVQDAKWQEATEKFEYSLEIFSTCDNKWGIAETRKGIGNIHYARGDYEKALVEYKSAHELYSADQNNDGIARTLKSIGDIHLKRGAYDQALVSYGEAKSIFATLGNKMGEASCLYGSADVDYTQANYYSAVLNYEGALSIYEKINARFELANVYRSIADIRVRQGDYDVAKKLFEKAKDSYSLIGAASGVALTYRGIGDILIKQGHYEDAKKMYEESIKVFEKANLGMEYATGLLRIGDVYHRLGQLEQALITFDKVYDLYKSLGGRMGIANVHLRKGKAFLELKKPNDSLLEYQRAFQQYSQLGGKLGVANSLKGIADVHLFLEDSELAIENYQAALQIYIAIRVDAGKANSYYGIADAYSINGAENDAERFYILALELYTQLGYASEVEQIKNKLKNKHT
jgi:tetratricopeptide (TPR) repeat protein